MAETCRCCDDRPATASHGVCPSCREELRFITRPAAHRELWRRHIAELAPERQEWERRGVVFISNAPAANDLWLCDACNATIPVDAEQTLIPLHGTWALCGRCVAHLPYWPDAWTQQSPRGCPCDACQLPLHRLRLQQQISRHRNPPELGLA
jgi:hypothetical protein